MTMGMTLRAGIMRGKYMHRIFTGALIRTCLLISESKLLSLAKFYSEVLELHYGRTSRTIRSLTSLQSTLPLTMKICSVQSFACAHWDGHHGAQGWLRLWFSDASQSS
jgi:hypothetical protein